MAGLTSRERFLRAFEHRPADRIPVVDSPWGSTLARWRREGLPADGDWRDAVGLDHIETIHVDNGPRYPERILEETDAYVVKFNSWGATVKNFKHATSTPQDLDFTVKDRASWEQTKKRITPSRDRIHWDRLARDYPVWRRKGAWVQGLGWFGFDIVHARLVGTERTLMALIDDPEWFVDMVHHLLDVNLALLDAVWEAGYTFDALHWPDDLGYKLSQFMSVPMYRTLLKPAHRKAADWAHAKGIKVHLHSCGDIRPFIPEWIEIGIDCLNPLEVKAGVDPLTVKRQYGERLCLHGGTNAVLYTDPEALAAEMRRTVPVLAAGGGYIWSTDHSVPDVVSLEDFRRIVRLAKELGSYQ